MLEDISTAKAFGSKKNVDDVFCELAGELPETWIRCAEMDGALFMLEAGPEDVSLHLSGVLRVRVLTVGTVPVGQVVSSNTLMCSSSLYIHMYIHT